MSKDTRADVVDEKNKTVVSGCPDENEGCPSCKVQSKGGRLHRKGNFDLELLASKIN